MGPGVKTNIALLLTALSIAGCVSSPEPQADPYNDADSQRSRAGQAQGGAIFRNFQVEMILIDLVFTHMMKDLPLLRYFSS